ILTSREHSGSIPKFSLNYTEDIVDFIPLQDFLAHDSVWQKNRYQQLVEWSMIQSGGLFKPKECGSFCESRSVILVPYRNRTDNLIPFLSYIHPFLQRQGIEYQIVFISQSMTTSVDFNRGALINIGFLYAMNRSSIHQPWNCIIIHDVDHLPESEDNIYTCSDVPIHMNSNDNGLGLPYQTYFGGVGSIKPGQFKAVNGLPNRYFGWGGEDDDFQERLNRLGLKWRHINQTIGRQDTYVTLGHEKARPNSERFRMLERAKKLMFKDGLNSTKFQLMSVLEEKLYVNITVDFNKS
ncbi:hypothetical protein TCAL_13671, partial [Tigriopus californicus]